jgi:WS/DGAT/MGAT family acyltransferase
MASSERMSGVDRAWLLMEQPTNPMMIVGLIVTSTPVAYEQLCEIVRTRFLTFERFRCRPEGNMLGARWVTQPGFDLRDHVLRAALPGDAGQEALEDLVSELASTPLSMLRPLWTFHLVEHYRGGSALVVRIHHCYADGIALVRVLLSLADRARKRHQPSAHPPAHGSVVGLVPHTLGEAVDLVRQGMHHLLHPSEAVGLAAELARVAALPGDPPTGLRGTLTGARRVAWIDPLPFEEVHALGRVLGCTINDVLVATLAGALGRYLEAHGETVAGLTIRAAVPVNLRPDDGSALTLGNRFGLVFLDLPIGIRHPLERLYAVHATMQALKRSRQPLVTLGLLAIVGELPAPVEEPVMALFSAKASLVASSLRGPEEQLRVGGAPVSHTMFWVPQSGSLGLGISMLTYNRQVQFGVISDRGLVADPRELLRLVREEFERLALLVLLGA